MGNTWGDGNFAQQHKELTKVEHLILLRGIKAKVIVLQKLISFHFNSGRWDTEVQATKAAAKLDEIIDIAQKLRQELL